MLGLSICRTQLYSDTLRNARREEEGVWVIQRLIPFHDVIFDPLQLALVVLLHFVNFFLCEEIQNGVVIQQAFL